MNPAISFLESHPSLSYQDRFANLKDFRLAHLQGLNEYVIRYIFKKMNSYGMPGAMLGRNGDKDVVVAAFFDNRSRRWTESDPMVIKALQHFGTILGCPVKGKWYWGDRLVNEEKRYLTWTSV